MHYQVLRIDPKLCIQLRTGLGLAIRLQKRTLKGVRQVKELLKSLFINERKEAV